MSMYRLNIDITIAADDETSASLMLRHVLGQAFREGKIGCWAPNFGETAPFLVNNADAIPAAAWAMSEPHDCEDIEEDA